MTITHRAWACCLLIALATSVVAAERSPPLEPMVRPPPPIAERAPAAVKAAPSGRPAAKTPCRLPVDPGRLKLRSASLVVVDPATSRVVVAREPERVRPIASVTKLMTAMVVLDARLRLDELLRISTDDIDRLKGTHSRLPVGTRLTRREMLHLALMASENRAASALARHYPGGFQAFVRAMNRKASALGMRSTHFVDSTGLSQRNVSTARDLSRMVQAAHRYPVIRRFTTSASLAVRVTKGGPPVQFRNSNRLVQTGSKEWRIEVSKTGYTSEAGRCLVMHTRIGRRPLILVLLNSWGKLTPVGDANRIRRWLEAHPGTIELASRGP